MKICYVGNIDAVHTQRWAKAFAEKGHEVDVIYKIADGFLQFKDKSSIDKIFEKYKKEHIEQFKSSIKIKGDLLKSMILSIKDLAYKLSIIFKKKIILKRTPLAEGGTKVRVPNINKIKKLGFKSKFYLDKGLRETLGL